MKVELKNRDDIIKILNYCENNFNTCNWKLNEDMIWPLIRFELGYMLYWKLDSLEFKRNKFKLLFNAIKNVFFHVTTIKNSNRLTKDDYQVLFFSDTGGYSLVENIWYEKNCDTLIDQLREGFGYNSLKLDYNYNNYFPKYRDSIQIRLILDIITLKSFLKKKSNINKSLVGFHEFVSFCYTNDFQISLISLKNLERRYLIWKSLENYFLNKLLRNKGLKLCFVLTYYGFHSSALVSASKKLKIPVIDIQHGIQGKGHFAYSSWTNYPEMGYNQLPNIFWCWTQEDYNNILSWSIKSTKSIHLPFVGGNLFLNLFLNSNSSFSLNIIESLKKNLWGREYKILYSCSLFKYEIENSSIIDVIKATEEDIEWVIRLHPQEKNDVKKFESYFKQNGIKKVHIDWSSKAPLYGLLKIVNLHVTLNSSTILESETFNVPSIALDKSAIEMYSSQLKTGTCKFMLKDELINYIKNKQKSRGIQSQIILSKTNSLSDFLDLVNKLQFNV